ncbi:MAG: GNAT family acetyltransferase [Kiloniellales bacterium]
MTQHPGGNNALTIRPYREADRDAVVALWRRCELIKPWNDPDQDIALAAATSNAELFVGEHDGVLCAACLVGHDGHRGWLYYLATEPEQRRKGFGLAMVRHCEAWLSQRKVPKVQLLVRETNLATKAFYARIGYTPNPCHIMQRWLVERGAPNPVPGGRPDGKLELTVTYLEMTEPPREPPLHPPHGVKLALLRAVDPTVPYYRFLYNEVGGPWLWWERRVLSDEALAAIIHDERVEIYVLYHEGVPAGFAELDRRGGDEEISLAYFGLMLPFIGRRLGGFFMTSVIDIAWSHDPKRLTVNTNTLDHAKALSLYQRCGFRPTHRVDQVIDDPRVTGIIPIS